MPNKKINRFVGDDSDVVFPEGILEDVESNSDSGSDDSGEDSKPAPEEADPESGTT